MSSKIASLKTRMSDVFFRYPVSFGCALIVFGMVVGEMSFDSPCMGAFASAALYFLWLVIQFVRNMNRLANYRQPH